MNYRSNKKCTGYGIIVPNRQQNTNCIDKWNIPTTVSLWDYKNKCQNTFCWRQITKYLSIKQVNEFRPVESMQSGIISIKFNTKEKVKCCKFTWILLSVAQVFVKVSFGCFELGYHIITKSNIAILLLFSPNAGKIYSLNF